MLIRDAIALRQREGISYMLGVSGSLRTVVARVWVGLVACGCWGGGACVVKGCVVVDWLCCVDT